MPSSGCTCNRSLFSAAGKATGNSVFLVGGLLILASQPSETNSMVVGCFSVVGDFFFCSGWFFVFFYRQALSVWQPVSWKSRAFLASWEMKPCSVGQAVHIIMHRIDL